MDSDRCRFRTAAWARSEKVRLAGSVNNETLQIDTPDIQLTSRSPSSRIPRKGGNDLPSPAHSSRRTRMAYPTGVHRVNTV